MHVLITGGAGYVGANLTELLLRMGMEVTVYDALVFGIKPLLGMVNYPKLHIVHGDIRDKDQLTEALQDVDMIVHLAAVVGYPSCEADPILAIDINVGGTEALTQVAKVPILFASTGSVYGHLDELCEETSLLNPLSLYAESKATGEELIRAHRGDNIIFRFATAYGPSPRLRLDLLPNDFTYQGVHNGLLDLYEADAMRTFINVLSMAYAFVHALQNQAELGGETYNVGSDNYSKLEVAQMVANVTGCQIKTDMIGSDPDGRDYEVSYVKFSQAGWREPAWLASMPDTIRKMATVFRFIDRAPIHDNRTMLPVFGSEDVR